MTLRERCLQIVNEHSTQVTDQIARRRVEMEEDETDHYLLYRILGIEEEECPRIDLYQNVGRFLYYHAGKVLERLTAAIFEETQGGRRIYIPNTITDHPVRFEIDSYVEADNKAHEIKWRDATTDGDHISKEETKVHAILNAGLVPVRVMYFMPQRREARRIQERIIRLYREHGHAYISNGAWDYVQEYTGFNLKGFLEELL